MKTIKLALLSLLLSVGFLNQIQAQRKSVTVKGLVVEKSNNLPLEYATIVLDPVDSPQITGGITDDKGKFSIEVKPGIYNLKIEFLSFKTLVQENVDLTKSINLGSFSLEEDANTLDAVEVVAEKTTVDIRLDKRIYNVGLDMTIKGGTASDVLNNVPSVSVDVDGTVSLRGNDNVRILINGKPSGLVGLTTTDVLRQFPADAIEKVEVITSPSARYDAEGTAGILNIILRKGKALGFNASVNLSGGYPDLYSGNANINYRTEKVNFFTNFGYRFSEAPGYSYSDLTYFNTDGSVNFYRSEYTDWTRNSDSNNNNIGLEYFINDYSSITAAVLYRIAGGGRYSVNDQKNYDTDYVETEYTQRIQDQDSDRNLVEYSINYTGDFEDDSNLQIDIKYEDTSEEENSMINDNVIIGNEASTQERITQNDAYTNWLFQLDYVKPLGENSQFEFGAKATINDFISDYLVEDLIDGTWERNTDFSNELEFDQDVYAAYAQYGNKFERLNFLFGLRYEHTDIHIDLKTTNQIENKNYGNFFPTLNLGYELNGESSITFGYAKRIRRPRSWFLNPFPNRTSETNFFTGNPDLDPTITGSYDLGFLKKFDNWTINSSIYYNHSEGAYEFIFEETGDFVNGVPVTIRYPINLATEDRIGFELTSRHSIGKWLRLNNSFNFFRFTKEGDYTFTNNAGDEVTQNFDAEDNAFFLRINSIVKLPGQIDWQTNFFYRSGQSNAQSDREGIYSINLAFSKDILKKNGTIAFNVSDLLNSRARAMTTTTYSPDTGLPTITNESDMMWRQRQFTATFTYRFKQKKKRGGRPSGGYDGGDMEMQGQP